MTKILAIPGSLRPNSSSNHILNELVSFVPSNATIEIYRGIGSLPHFNDAEEPSASVVDFRDRVREADVVLICTPEYAFGIPGSLKNAIDWTVSSAEFYNKPVGLVKAATHAEKGHAAMMLVLTAINAMIIEDASILISYVRSKLDSAGKIKDEGLSKALKKVVENLILAAADK